MRRFFKSRRQVDAADDSEDGQSHSECDAARNEVEPIPTAAVRVGPPWHERVGSEGELARALRLGEPPVVARVQGGAVLFDLRALRPDEDATLLHAVQAAVVG